MDKTWREHTDDEVLAGITADTDSFSVEAHEPTEPGKIDGTVSVKPVAPVLASEMLVLPEIEAGKCTANAHIYTEDALRKMVDDSQERIRHRYILVRSGNGIDAQNLGVIKALTFDGKNMHVAYDMLPGQPRVVRITPVFQGMARVDDGMVSHMELLYFTPFPPKTTGVPGNVGTVGRASNELRNLKADPASHIGTVDGMCKLLSKGDACTCLKCVLDKASERDVLRKAIIDYLDAESAWPERDSLVHADAPINILAATVGRSLDTRTSPGKGD